MTNLQSTRHVAVWEWWRLRARRSSRARWRVTAILIALVWNEPAGAGTSLPANRFTRTLTEEVRALSFTGYKGMLHAVHGDGGRGAPIEARDLTHLSALNGVVLLVHGSQYDPGRVGPPNPYSTFAHVVRSHLDPSLTGISFGWNSAPFNLKNQFAAFFRGSLSVYGLAGRNLDGNVPPLTALIRAFPPVWRAVCHSLGCELIQRTLAADPSLPRPKRMLLLSGDLREARLDRLAAADGIEVLAVRSDRDFPLARSAFRKESRAFWAGNAPRIGLWTDLTFHPEALEKGGRWSLRYKHRRRYWDHMATFEFGEPWPTYNRFLVSGPPVTAEASTALRPVGAVASRSSRE
jgi:hypothetical protein